MKPMTYKELGEKVAEQVLDDYLINGKTMREWINILSDNMNVLDKIRAEIDAARFIDKDTKLCKNANASGLEVAMQIIDKYREEQ